MNAAFIIIIQVHISVILDLISKWCSMSRFWTDMKSKLSIHHSRYNCRHLHVRFLRRIFHRYKFPGLYQILHGPSLYQKPNQFYMDSSMSLQCPYNRDPLTGTLIHRCRPWIRSWHVDRSMVQLCVFRAHSSMFVHGKPKYF